MRIFAIFLLSMNNLWALSLKPFTSDYCTFFPEGTYSAPALWQDCCLEHDLVYWAGGTKKQQDQSDKLLGQCVTKKSSSFYGRLMYRGVRLGHYSPIKSKTKWGHGWGDNRLFQKLSLKEKNIVRDRLLESNIKEDYKLKYLRLYIDN